MYHQDFKYKGQDSRNLQFSVEHNYESIGTETRLQKWRDSDKEVDGEESLQTLNLGLIYTFTYD